MQQICSRCGASLECDGSCRHCDQKSKNGRRTAFKVLCWCFLGLTAACLIIVGLIHANEYIINGEMSGSLANSARLTAATSAATTTTPTAGITTAAATTTTVPPEPVGSYPPVFEKHDCSSYYYADQYNQGAVEHAFDNNTETCWQDGVTGQGVGEWLTASSGELQFVSFITVYNGYMKSAYDLYYGNSRVRQFTVSYDGGSQTFELDDTSSPQTFRLTKPISTRSMTFRIDSVYEGTKYADTCITEIIFGADYTDYIDAVNVTQTETTVVQTHTEYTGVEQIITDDIARDIVLVLDISGSMNGTPLDETKKAASQFVSRIAGGNTRVGLVVYDTCAEQLCDFTADRERLVALIGELEDKGRTNLYDALETADYMLGQSVAERRIIVLMSDGFPNEGNGSYLTYEEYAAEAIGLADGYKAYDDYVIYTLGFFQDLDGSEKQSGRDLLRSVASEGYYYDVEDPESLEYFFSDIATAISGVYSIMIETDSRVDVAVTYGEETLATAEERHSRRTGFGSITYLGADDERLVLRLLIGVDYLIELTGLEESVIDYAISFPDNYGEYSDVRQFLGVPVTPDTVITTDTRSDRDTTMRIDKDGDGRSDIKLRAGVNAHGKAVKSYWWLYIILAALAATYAVLRLIGEERFVRMLTPNPTRRRAAATAFAGAGYPPVPNGSPNIPNVFPSAPNGSQSIPNGCASPAGGIPIRFCGNCGTPLPSDAVFCGNCGTRQNG